MSMQIRNFARADYRSAQSAVDNGARFVRFSVCYSYIFFTSRVETDIFLVRSYPSALWVGARYTLMTLLLGWWGIPFGPIHTIKALATNFRGGEDVTGFVPNELQNKDVSFMANRGFK